MIKAWSQPDMASMACASYCAYFIMTHLFCVRFSVFPLSNISVFPSYTSWVASKKSASLSKPKMTQVMKWMPVLKKGNQLPLLMSEKEREENLPEKKRISFTCTHVRKRKRRKFTRKKKEIFFTCAHVGKRCPAFHSRKPRPTPLLDARDVGLDLVSTNV